MRYVSMRSSLLSLDQYNSTHGPQCIHDIRTFKYEYRLRIEPHQMNCNPKHIHQHLLTRFVCWACRISRTVHMTYQSLHAIPNWDTHEANCVTDYLNRNTHHPHSPRDTKHSWPSWPLGLYKRVENSRIHHSEHHYHHVHAVSPHKKICQKNVLKGKKTYSEMYSISF